MAAADKDEQPKTTHSRAATTSTYGTMSVRSALKHTTSTSNTTPTGTAAAKSVCITIAEDERTPLLTQQSADTPDLAIPTSVDICELNQQQQPQPNGTHREFPKAIDWLAIVFLSVITSGMILSSYLLWRQLSEPQIVYRLHFVPHEVWSEVALPTKGFLDHAKVQNIVITHTGSGSCAHPEVCRNVLRALQRQQLNQQELLYNFLIGDDGQTYEARGWNFESGVERLSQASTLVIGLIGNYTLAAPSSVQLISVFSLLRESIKRRKLLSGYRVYALRNRSMPPNDADQLLRQVMRWPRYANVL